MIVYRICKQDELEIILSDKSFKRIEKTFKTNTKLNTNLYENEKKYLHFFKNKSSIFYLNTTKDMFICTYDIPIYLLEKYREIGFYLDTNNLKSVTEYAIENNYISFENLLKVQKIVDYIDIENYIYDDILSKVSTIYSNHDIINKLSNTCENESILNLYSILMNSNVKKSINSNLEYLINIIPEIKYMIGFEHKHPHHHLDVWEHTLYALSLSNKDFTLRLSLLLHDIGKPFSFSEKDGIRHFNNHPFISSEISKNILNRLEFNNDYINMICYLVKFHDTPITEKDIHNNYNLIFTRYLMQECDALAHNPNKLEKRIAYLNKTKKLILKK